MKLRESGLLPEKKEHTDICGICGKKMKNDKEIDKHIWNKKEIKKCLNSKKK